MLEIIEIVFQWIGYAAGVGTVVFAARKLHGLSQGRVSWRTVERAASRLGKCIESRNFDAEVVVGIGKGGAIVAGMLAHDFELPIEHVARYPLLRRDGTVKGMEIRTHGNLEVKNKNVLLVNGQSRSGTTIREAVKVVEGHGSARILTCALVALADGNEEHIEISHLPDCTGIATKRMLVPPWKQ